MFAKVTLVITPISRCHKGFQMSSGNLLSLISDNYINGIIFSLAMTKEWILLPPYNAGGEPAAHPWPFSSFTKKLDDILKSNGFTPNLKNLDNFEQGGYWLNRMYGSKDSPIVVFYNQEITDASFDASDEGSLPLSDMVGMDCSFERGQLYLPREVLLQRFTEGDYGREFIEFVVADDELRQKLLAPKYAEDMHHANTSVKSCFDNLESSRLQFGRHLHDKRNSPGFFEISYAGSYEPMYPQNGRTREGDILRRAEKIAKSGQLGK